MPYTDKIATELKTTRSVPIFLLPIFFIAGLAGPGPAERGRFGPEPADLLLLIRRIPRDCPLRALVWRWPERLATRSPFSLPVMSLYRAKIGRTLENRQLLAEINLKLNPRFRDYTTSNALNDAT